MMHVSWTTLREQIFAKLRRPNRSEANMNEVGHDFSKLWLNYFKMMLEYKLREPFAIS
jgi:hypothetical protein